MKVICVECKRSREKEGVSDGSSHGLCVKCAIATERGRGLPVDEISRDDKKFFKEELKKEIQNGVVWSGSEMKYAESDGLELYNKFLKEVKLEIDSDRAKELNKK